MRENRTSGSMRGCRKRATSRRACALLYQSPQFVGGSTPSLRGASVLLELSRRPIAESRVEPFLVVDALEKLPDAGASLLTIAIFVAIHFLVLQRFDERFADGVVIRVSFAAHADARLVLLEYFRIRLRS